MNYEIWLLGDFNIDFLRRDDVNTVKLNRFVKKIGLSQVINGITRPNTKGGSCLDLIISDCKYISDSGILNDLVADHYSIFSVLKKKREIKETVIKTIRDYRNFDEENFGELLIAKNWEDFDNSLNPDVQWERIYQYCLEILSVMCPYKTVHTHKKKTPWVTQEIYSAIRKKQRLIKKFKTTGDLADLRFAKIQRNLVNSLIYKAKKNYIVNSLNLNVKKNKEILENNQRYGGR